MRKALLTRNETSDAGTFGRILTDTGFTCFTGELPWRDNEPEYSSIPVGKYTCTWRFSPAHGDCYHVEGVPNRTDVEIHSANFVGDTTMGLQCQLLGCIAPGLAVGPLEGQRAILESRAALEALQADLNKETFELTIEENFK